MLKRIQIARRILQEAIRDYNQQLKTENGLTKQPLVPEKLTNDKLLEDLRRFKGDADG